MANELETPSFGNFSIVDSMEMGAGNQALLNDLLSPETVTTKTEDVTKITPPDKKKVEKVPEVKKEKEKEEEEEVPEEEIDILAALEEKVDEGNDQPEKDKTPKEKEEGAEEPVSDNKFSALSKDLFKLGVFSKDEGEEDLEINSPEEFLERFNYEKKKGAIETIDNFIGQFGEEYQEAFDAIFVKGVSPKEYFGTYNKIEDFASLDLKDEMNQIAVIKQGLLDQGFEPDKIAAKIEKIKNYGDLEDEATAIHQVLVKKEAAKLAQIKQDSENKLQQFAAIKQQYIKNVNTILQDKLKSKEFDGIPLNPKLATELQDFLITDKYKTPTGETLTEFDKSILELKRPENHEKKVKIALLLKLIEKDPTLSTIQRTGITKKTDTLFGELARQTGKSTTKTEKEKPSSWFVQ